MSSIEIKNLSRTERRKLLREIEKDYDPKILNEQCFCGSEIPFRRCCKNYNQNYDPILSLKNFVRKFSENEILFLDKLASILGIGLFISNQSFSVSNLKYRVFNFSYAGEAVLIQTDDFKLKFTSGPTENSIEIFTLEVFNSGDGIGSDIMNKIKNMADEEGISIYLIPIDFKDTPKEVLMKWYSKLGFKLIKDSCYWNYEPEVQKSYKMAS